ncbi:hypothetical protein KUW15_00770 [Qipengyuania aquimaris]|uniref:hypothetical protein n=1 Tax=Qipengyuania aquimaris TaxID=255984 RepID=UPI001C9760E2|nr:hypothetical protein [Qipengyuania aquimaris]MBY6127239.1 hypothetical protein [Qipengyuania aquimaris]
MALGVAQNWPWSLLGIAETSDKEAIRAAYAARKAELDFGAASLQRRCKKHAHREAFSIRSA